MLWIGVTCLIRPTHGTAGLFFRLAVVAVIMSLGQPDRARPTDVDCGPTVPPMVGWQRSRPCLTPTTGYGSSVIEDFAIQTFRGLTLNNVGLNITWNATVTKPGNLFKLDMRVIIPYGVEPEPCIVFTMKTTSSSKQFFYNQFCQQFVLDKHSVVEVKLWQLASPPKLVFQSNVTIIRQEENYVGSSAKWVTDIMVYPNRCDRSIRADFMLAPTEYDFCEYSVSLVLSGRHVTVLDDTIRPKSGDTMGSLMFYNVTPENYTVNVKPTERNKCMCTRRLHATPGINNCYRSCLMIQSVASYMHGPDASCTEKKKSNLLLLILLPSVAGLIMAIAVIICGKKYRGNSHGLLSSCKRKRPPSVPKKIIIAHWDAVSHHTDVVQCLEALLTKHCCCDVVDLTNTAANDLNNFDAWIIDRLHGVDKILVIESEGAYYKYHHRDFTSGYGQPDVFTPVLDYIKRQETTGNTTNLISRLISVRFDYTESTYVLNMPSNTSQFRLMSDFKKLYCAIHASNGRQSNAREYLNDDVRNSREWSNLMYAIDKMHDYISNLSGFPQSPPTPPGNFIVHPPMSASLISSISRLHELDMNAEFERQHLLENGDAHSVGL